MDEVEGIRKALRLGRIHLFGDSYGGALALDVALRHSGSLSSLIVSSGYASAALNRSEQPRLMSRMPKWVRDTTARYKAKGNLKHPKYLEAVEVFDRKHYCRLRVWPYDWWYMTKHYRPEVSHGRMKGWDVTDRLPEIKIPCLVTVGRYDVVTPKCSQAIHQGIRGSKLVLFAKSSHSAMWEERQLYIEAVHSFLDEVRPL